LARPPLLPSTPRSDELRTPLCPSRLSAVGERNDVAYMFGTSAFLLAEPCGPLAYIVDLSLKGPTARPPF
jgi:hypothetical protein